MTDIKRRGIGLGIVLGAAAFGTGAWLRSRNAGLVPAAEAQTLSAPGPLPTPLTTLDGRTLGAADIAGRAVMLNFWAPWCPPCVREMPDIDRFARSPAGKNTLVVGLAIDEKAAVDRFLAAHPVGFPIVVLGYAGLSWVRKLGNDGQALPFSAFFDRQGKYVQHRVGPTTTAELSDWARTI
jgi:thiol-disulfide isomerase/thioredoxin